MMNYKTVDLDSDAIGERNDCVVKALALVCQLPYKQVHDMLKSNGRRKGDGTNHITFDATKKTLEGMGYKFTQETPRYVYPDGHEGKYTMKTIGGVYPEGNVLLQSTGHQAALIDGEIQDWTQGRMHRVHYVWVVTKGAATKVDDELTQGDKDLLDYLAS